MSRQRDFLKEITDIRARFLFGYAYPELIFRRFALDQVFKQRTKVDPEFLRYFPVALVACFEGFFRLAVKEFVDAGPPYLDRAAKLTAGVKFDFELLKALQGKKLTLGELIAHHLSWNSLAQINANISILMEKDFLTGLRTIEDRAAHEVAGKPNEPILAEPDLTFRSVERVFELRHIICHEIASAFEILPHEIDEGYAHSIRFLDAAIALINDTLQPNALLTQAQINTEAGRRLHAAQRELDELDQALRGLLDENRAAEYAAVNEVWQSYVELASKFEADEAKGGSSWPTLYSGAAESLVRERIEHVRYLLQREKLFRG